MAKGMQFRECKSLFNAFLTQTWTNYKHNLKKKAAQLKLDQVATGGGPPCNTTLNPIEERILAIIGKSFYEGIGKPEIGIPQSRIENPKIDVEEIKVRNNIHACFAHYFVKILFTTSNNFR